jgi:hypothetical protein
MVTLDGVLGKSARQPTDERQPGLFGLWRDLRLSQHGGDLTNQPSPARLGDVVVVAGLVQSFVLQCDEIRISRAFDPFGGPMRPLRSIVSTILAARL